MHFWLFLPFPFFSGNAISLIRPEFCQRHGYCNSSGIAFYRQESHCFWNKEFSVFFIALLLFFSLFSFFLSVSVFFHSLCDFVRLSVSSLETFSFGLVPWMPQQTATIVPHRNNFKDLFKVNESIVLICGVKAEVTLILFNSRHSLSPNMLARASDLLFG